MPNALYSRITFIENRSTSCDKNLENECGSVITDGSLHFYVYIRTGEENIPMRMLTVIHKKQFS